jgi:hypothetical protein
MRNIASLILALGVFAALTPGVLAEETVKETTKSTKCVKHKRHCHKAGASKTAAPATENKTETKTETK